jgi:two-component system, LytTR family, response regulator LytT
MRILIVEDEAVVARRVEQLCRRILGEQLESIRLAETFDSAHALLAESPVDVLLLDLNLGGRDGMQLLESSVASAFHTVIVSANTDHALRAFEYGVLDFVPKPFSQDRLAQAFARVNGSTRDGAKTKYLAVKKHGRLEPIPVSEIVVVQGAGNYSELVLADGRRELHDKNLDKLHTLLAPEFERIHKSYLVRFTHVKALHAYEGSLHEAELKSGSRLPVGRSYYKDLRARLG